MVIFSDTMNVKKFLMNALGKTTDSERYLVDKETGERCLDINNEEVKLKDLGGIRKGSELIFKKDIGSLISYINRST